MAAIKKTKTVKKVTEIPEASVKIEIEQIEDEAEESDKSADEDKAEISASNADDSDKETPEEEEPEEKTEALIENFDDENSRFSWSKVFLFIVISAVTGFVIISVYLFLIEDYDFSLTKEEAKNTLEVEEELSPTPTPETADRSAYDILILNGSGIAGEAANIQSLLEDENFSVNEIGNAETADYTNTQILYAKDVDEKFLEELKTVLETRGPTRLEEADEDQTEDVVVIVGSELTEEEATPTPELE